MKLIKLQSEVSIAIAPPVRPLINSLMMISIFRRFASINHHYCVEHLHHLLPSVARVILLFIAWLNLVASQQSLGQAISHFKDIASDSSSQLSAKLPNEVPVERVVFGSCIKQDQPMPIFSEMLQANPDLALLIGDNIYGDSDDMAVLRRKYEKLRGNHDYAEFENSVPILATWDDHDYGLNDGGADFAKRSDSQIEFMRFWRIPRESNRWTREGVYHSEIFGPAGRRLQVILLDTRFFRSELKKGLERRIAGPYVADDDPQKTMLGETQWKWLREQLLQPADVRLLVTSIQCIPESAGQETWSNLPCERKRLFNLLRSTSAQGVILLSGDRHWAELSVLESELDYSLYELTSSSLNQKHPRGTPSENRFRAQPKTYHEENFGVINITWDSSGPFVELELRDLKGSTQFIQKVSF